MQFTEKIKNKIINLLHTKSKNHPIGSSCLYLQLNKNIGAKLYRDKKIRNGAIKNQSKLSKLKMSPKVGSEFEIPFLMFNDFNQNESIFLPNAGADIDWIFYYGYLTQHADKVNSRKDFKAISNFLESIKKLGYDTYDLENNRNIGKINNRIVCIDTDSRTLIRN